MDKLRSMFFVKRILSVFFFIITFSLSTFGKTRPIEYKEITLSLNINSKGHNVINKTFIENLKNVIIVINENFDLQGKTLILNENVCLKFNGGSISNGQIQLQKSNEICSTIEKQCFYNIKFSGTYSKVFPLSLIGVIADGKDKSEILSNLSECIYSDKNSIYCVFNKLSINGNIICDKNEIDIPANLDLYGSEGAKISFTSANGDYCISISHNTGLHNISLNNTNLNYLGAILTADCRIYNKAKNLYGGAAFLNLNNVKISGKYSDNGDDFKCVGIRLVASNKYDKDFSYFTNIQSDILRITYTKIGLEVIYQNYEKDKYTWGNEINFNNLYISANTCGIKITTEEYAKKRVIQESGHSCFDIYKFQALKQTAVAFDIETVSQIIFLDFVSWDNSTWGIIRKNASVGVLYDMRPFLTLSNEKKKDINGNTYLTLKEKDKERYKIYKGLLERKMIVYKQ